MFKALLMALAIAFTTSLFAQSKAATEAWVANYVSNNVAAIKASITDTYQDGIRTLSVTENGTNLTVKIEDPTVRALILKDCSVDLSSSGITNGIVFAYTDNGIYKNGANTIQATSSNLVLNNTYQSREIDGRCFFFKEEDDEQVARVYWTLIQPSYAKTLTNE